MERTKTGSKMKWDNTLAAFDGSKGGSETTSGKCEPENNCGRGPHIDHSCHFFVAGLIAALVAIFYIFKLRRTGL